MKKVIMKSSRSVPKKPAQISVSAADGEIASVISSMLEGLAGVSVQRKHNLSFLVGKKVFAFTRKDGVVLKLPEDRIRGLIETRQAFHLVMGKRVMREWVVLQHKDPGAFEKDLDLFGEAKAFVASSEN